MRDVVDTQVINDIVLIGEGLDIERDHLKSHLLQIRNGIFLNALAKGLAVGDHLFKAHLSNDLAHISFQRILYAADDHILIFVEEELGGERHHILALTDADLNGRVSLHVDILGIGDVVCRLDVDRKHLWRQPVHTLRERDTDPSAAN